MNPRPRPRSRSVLIVAVLLLAPVIPAVASALWHSRSPFSAGPESPVTVDDVSSRIVEVTPSTAGSWGGDVLWIDARSPEAYRADRIPGAVLLNETQWELHLFDVLDRLKPGQPVVVYCGSRTCGASQAVAERLLEETGFEKIYVLRGGWIAWQEEVSR